nr:DNA polymerase III subunit delta [Deinobacterium chartae]
MAFSGNRFLAEEALRDEVRARGLNPRDLPQLGGDDLTLEALLPLLQGSLFGPSNVIVDLEGHKGAKELLAAMEGADATLFVLDPAATAARIKIYEKAGQHRALPAPSKPGEVAGWVATRAKSRKLQLDRDAALRLAEIFGGDLASIAAELLKFELIAEGRVDAAMVDRVVNLRPPGDSFALLGAATAGRAQEAAQQLERLIEGGEDPFKLMGAVVWQYSLVARCVALRQENPGVNEHAAAQRLGVKPYPAKKALEVARRLNEDRIRVHLVRILEADRAMKSGTPPRSALERLVLQLSL